jgi:cobalt-zinc-cadmium efflux system outer membrane protein
MLAVRLVLLALALAGPARAEVPSPTVLPGHVGFDDALRLFHERGLDLLIADAQVSTAQAEVFAAGAIPNPQLGVSAGGSFTYNASACPGCSAVSWTISASDNSALMDTASGRRRLRIQVTEAALAAARFGRADAQRTLEYQVKSEYLQAVLARDSLDFLREVQNGWQKVLELNQVRYQAGAISETDVAKVETAKLEADQDADRAEQDLRTAKIGLAFLLGVRGPVPEYSIEQDLPKYHVPAALANVSPEALLREAFARRPDLRQIAEQRRRAELSIKAAKRQLVPDLSLGAQYTQEGTGQNAVQPPTLTVGLTLTLPVFYQYRGEIARARADALTQSLTQAKTEAQVVNDVEAAFAGFTGARRRVERMEARLLERARRARDLVQIQYQKGAASLLEYLDAQRTYISTNIEYLKDLADFWTSVYQLEQVVGMELRR